MKKKFINAFVIVTIVSAIVSGYYLYGKAYFKPIKANNTINSTENINADISPKVGNQHIMGNGIHKTPEDPMMNGVIQVNGTNIPEIFVPQDKSVLKSFNNKVLNDVPLFPKEVFLTFDDGPSSNTPKLLKILDEKNVKATFFIIGKNADTYPAIVRAEFNDGMSIVNHSYSHQPSIYNSVEECVQDFNRCSTAIKNITGIEPLPFVRFPGGSDNKSSNPEIMKNIRNTFAGQGIDYVDWNISSGDAATATVPAAVIADNLMKQLSGKHFSIILMHDAPTKTTTVEALPGVIDYLKKEGFVFRTFNNLTAAEEKKMITQKIINRGAGQ